MPGDGHETYRYPKGKPLPLKILDTFLLRVPIVVIAGILIIDSRRWLWFVPLVLVFVVLIFINRKLLQHYVSTGRAVPIPRSLVVVRYQNGKPAPILALRIAFVADVAMMLVFGLAPFTHETAKIGVIGLIALLIGISVAYIFVERHYVRKGVALEVEIHFPETPPKAD
jgi:hypothetical protein